MALKPFNSVAGFSVGEVPALNIILANGDITASNVTLTGNLLISNANASWGVLTNNLFYANGVPWDLQEAAGSNTQIQFNNNNNFGASANFTFDTATNLLTVVGNLNATGVTASTLTSNITTGTAPLTVASTTKVTNLNADLLDGYDTSTSANANTVAVRNADGNLTANYFIGNGSQLTGIDATSIQNGNSNVKVAANGNVSISVTGTSNVVIVTDTGMNVSGYITSTGNVTSLNADLGNLVTANFINVSSNIVSNNTTVNLEFQANTANFDGNVTMDSWLSVANTANVGNLRTDNLLYANGLPWDMQEAAGNNNEIQFNINDNFAASANLTYNDSTQQFTVLGNGQFNNANLGNIATANFANFASNVTTSNVTVNLELAGNTANFSGNVVVPNLTVNLALSGNTANFSGNVIAGNFIGALANGNSNVTVYSNSNVEISINGTANIATFTGNSLSVVGNINSTAGNMLANGNVTANGFLVGANAVITGEANLSSVLTSNITANGNLTITASGTNKNISLVPSGTGVVDVSLKNIIQVAGPINPNDAATKEYVDSTAQGLTIHTAVLVTSLTNLNATYANGGSVLTTIAITGNKTIQFSAAHGLSVDDELAWDNSFNNIVGDDPYFVFSIPAADTITVKEGYFGAEVTTLTNGTGLSQTAKANTGVGATLTNAGANAAISIDSIALASTNRVLVQGQTNQFENGVYTVTTVGNGSTAWVLTRATEEDTYSPTETTALGYGDYFFVQQGTNNAGSSYVLTTPTGEILFGLTNIQFSQFSAAGTFSAGSGIAITGTIISANVDNDTTAISSGNIVVKTSANFTTPNLGDATFSSLSWNTLSNGNVSANNLSIGNVANIGSNLTVAGNVQVTYDIDSNANIYSNNSDVTNFLTVGANITGNNITSNNLITTVNANISSNLVTSNATINLELSGNTANFSGNVILSNLTVNLALSGNTANFTGNVSANNLSLTNIISANIANIATKIDLGNTDIGWGTVTTTSISANQTISAFVVTAITGVEFLVKGIDSSGSKYSVSTVQAVTDGANVDFTTFATVNLGGLTGILSVNIVGSNIALQVTPTSANSTVWTTQYRTI